MLKIGLTGGIGSGKSTVAKVFESLGVPVYKADDEAKKLMATDPQLIDLIKKHFSEEVYKEGKLDKAYLASVVFNNKEKFGPSIYN